MSNTEARKGGVLRQPIVVVLGHVDHGKTTLLDRIRGTAVAKREPGEITQHVGASLVPARVIEELARPLKKMFPVRIEVPGLLFIDTPGHELFANMRRRGGSVADYAVLVVDVMEGVKEQTVEALNMLRERKVPFVVAANKIDKVPGWRPSPNEPFIVSVKKQSQKVVEELDRRVYLVVNELSKHGFDSDRFDRVRDFAKTVPVVPVSAKTGEGMAELLAVLAGLCQRYLAERLRFAEGPGKGVVLEVKEEVGLGHTVDVILYDGVIKRGDTIVLGSLEGPLVTRVRALLMPKPLDEMRSPEDRFRSVDVAYAACGVKVVAPNLERAVAGSPLFVVERAEEVEQLSRAVVEEVERVRIRGDSVGVVVKADTLGTLEALVEALRRLEVPIRIADVGPVSRRDVVEASVSIDEDETLAAILAFNVKVLKEAEEEAKIRNVKVFVNNIIYRLVEEYVDWRKHMKETERKRLFDSLVRPAKLKVLRGYVFRRSDPAIVGIEILGGVLRPGAPLMREDGRRLGAVLQIQERGRPLPEARRGQQVAISIKGNVMVGRHFDEDDVLYTDVPSQHAMLLLTEFRSELSEDELEVLNELVKLKRREDPFYAFTPVSASRATQAGSV